MPLTSSPFDPDASDTDLTYDRTIDRALVASAAVSEVFLTDARAIDACTVIVAAQLPRCHGYFNDHVGSGARVDPLLLLEIARQAQLASVALLNVAHDVMVVSKECHLEILDLDPAKNARQPIELTIKNTFDPTFIKHENSMGICKQEIAVNNRIVATCLTFAKLVSPSQHQALRLQERGNVPPLTLQMSDRQQELALPPAQVGRVNPLNVVLARSEFSDGIVRAVIAPPWQNRALFDASYNHLTPHILVEAARQLAILTLTLVKAADAADWAVRLMKGTFHQFAEIDLPVAVTANMSAAGDDNVQIDVDIVQAGQEIAHIVLQLTLWNKGRFH